MKATPDSGYIMVGTTLYFYPVPGWILKVDKDGCLIPGCLPTNSASSVAAAKPELVVYPNPVSDVLAFTVRDAVSEQFATFRILNTEGRILKTYENVHLHTTCILPIKDWQSGTYILQYLQGTQVIAAKKFVKL